MDPGTRRLLNVIIASAMIWFAVRVTQVESREGGLPFQSANDRSRWSTVRSLVDHGTYAIDDVIRHKGWDTIDKVAHPGRDGQLHYFSSKPTLLPTLIAIPYWLLRQLTGWTLEHQPLLVGRTLVALVNGAFLLGLFLPLRNLLLRYAPNRETAVFVMLFATWGTYLTSFAVTINNHLAAATAVMLSAAGFLTIERRQREAVSVSQETERAMRKRPVVFMVTGMAAAFAVMNELPALSYFTLLAASLLWLDPRPTLRWFVPGAAVVFLVAMVTNYLAHQSLTPPYMHRVEGADWSSGNWYVYPGSYWSDAARSAIDQGEPSRGKYAFHVLIGHHGILSLTPVWLLLLAGIGRWPSDRERRWLATITLVATAVCLFFYIGLRPQGDRNYGGRSVAFRWALWLIPLWWILLVDPIARVLRGRLGRAVAWLLLVASIASAAYGWLLPWKHPWLYFDAAGK